MEFHLKSKFTSERQLTMMSIFLLGCMLTVKPPSSSLMHVVIIPLLKCKSKDPADVATTGQLQLPQLSPRYLSRSYCRDSPGTCVTSDSQFGFKRAHGTEMAIFALKQTFSLNQDTPV